MEYRRSVFYLILGAISLVVTIAAAAFLISKKRIRYGHFESKVLILIMLHQLSKVFMYGGYIFLDSMSNKIKFALVLTTSFCAYYYDWLFAS